MFKLNNPKENKNIEIRDAIRKIRHKSLDNRKSDQFLINNSIKILESNIHVNKFKQLNIKQSFPSYSPEIKSK